jgi:hypothetical protein
LYLLPSSISTVAFTCLSKLLSSPNMFCYLTFSCVLGFPLFIGISYFAFM